MMLADRNYIKRKKDAPTRSVLQVFLLCAILLNVCVFLSQQSLLPYLRFSWLSVLGGEVWRPISSLFISQSANFLSFIFDLLIFYYAGQELLVKIGEIKLRLIFRQIMLACVLSMIALCFLAPNYHFAYFSYVMISIVFAYSVCFYEESRRFMLFFIVPVDLKGKHILVLIALYAAFLVIQAKLLALIPLCLCITLVYLVFKEKRKMMPIKGRVQKLDKRTKIQKGFRVIDKDELADPEVDRILDKILEQGMESLSTAEKGLLESRKKNENS